MLNPTIAGISTPLGPGAIGIIRISGPDARALVGKLFTPANFDHTKRFCDIIRERHIYYGFIKDPSSGILIDEAIVFFMGSPRSYTCEDVVEIQSHSGYVVLEQILQVIIKQGIRLAEPGEFTKRAFLNGRIDLGQAEAIIDKINAASTTASQLASQQMNGGLRAAIGAIIRQLTSLLVRYEALIDFSEYGDIDEDAERALYLSLAEILPALKSLITRQKETEIIKKGINITIAGVPNAGKSSLLNKITSRNTAIVSEYPGTTRDIIKDYISINGISANISDTAGIHDTDDPIERLGIERAQAQIQTADLILLVVEGTRQLNEYEKSWLVSEDREKVILVINKVDIANSEQVEGILRKSDTVRAVPVSAKSGQGIDILKRVIFDHLMIKDFDYVSDALIPNMRQGNLLEKVYDILSADAGSPEDGSWMELTAESLRNAIRLLEDVCGIHNDSDIYDDIFSQFCIGK